MEKYEFKKIDVSKHFEIRINEEHDVDSILKQIRNLRNKMVKNGFEKITLYVAELNDDENNLPSSAIYLRGYRKETTKEWHCRLEREKISAERQIRESQNVLNNIDIVNDNIKKINAVLNKSPLKCIKCKKFVPYIILHEGKEMRICEECLDKIRDKRKR